MSIRFACQHCKQRLNVREDKAGKVAKCPKCKKTITVPTPEEAEAARAAREKESPPAEHSIPAEETKAANQSRPPSNIPLSNESEVDANPIDSPPTKAEVAEADGQGEKTEKQEGDASDSEENPFAAFAVYDEEVELVYDVGEVEAAVTEPSETLPVDPNKVAVPRAAIYTQGVMLGVVAIVAFTLGILVGGGGGGQPTLEAENGPTVLVGTLQYRDRDNTLRPDNNAIAILLPENPRPKTKIPIQGLRPEFEHPDDTHPGLIAIHQAHGAYARANAKGEFKVKLPGPGAYYIFVLSPHAHRPNSDSPTAKERSRQGLLASYFDDPHGLIRKNKYAFTVKKIEGTTKFHQDFGQTRK